MKKIVVFFCILIFLFWQNILLHTFLIQHFDYKITKTIKMLQNQGNEQDQLNRQYSEHEFKEIVRQLSYRFNFKHISSIDNSYNQLIIQKGKVTGTDIAEFLQTKTQQQHIFNQLSQEITFYKQKINYLKYDLNCSSITKEQFIREFYNNIEISKENRTISEQILQRIENTNYISLNKLEEFILKVEWKTKVVNQQVRFPSEIIEFEKSNYIDVEKFEDVNNIEDIDIQKQLNSILKKIGQIPDQLLNSAIEDICKKISASHQHLMEKFQQKQILEQKLRNYKQQLQHLLEKTEKDLDDNMNNSSKKIKKLEETIQQKNKQLKQSMQAIYTLQSENQFMNKEKDQILVKNHEISSQLKWAQDNYKQLHKLYEQEMERQEQLSRQTQKKEESRLFTHRSLKEELQDARQKIEKMRIQKQKLKEQLMKKEALYMGQINQLQQKLEQTEDMLRTFQRKNQFSQIRSSLYQHSSYPLQKSKYMDSVMHSKVSIMPNNQLITSKFHGDHNPRKNESSFIVLASKIQQNMNVAFKKKKQMISSEITTILLNQNQSTFNNLDEIGIQKTSQLKKALQQAFKNQMDQKQIEKNYSNKPFYCCNAFYVTNSDRYFPTNILILEEQMIMLDTKLRYNSSFKANQVKRIYFCYYNPGWIVFQFKENQVNEKGHNIADIVLSLRNREGVGEYIKKNWLKSNKIQLKLEKQENIWVKNANNKEIMLSHYPQYYNLFRISLMNADAIFEANIKQPGLLNPYNEVFLVVTQIGILAFIKDGSQLLDKSCTILEVIPIVQKMQITEILQKIELILSYDLSKKKTKIKMKSIMVLEKLKNAILMRKEQIPIKKRKNMGKLGIRSFTSSLKNSHNS